MISSQNLFIKEVAKTPYITIFIFFNKDIYLKYFTH